VFGNKSQNGRDNDVRNEIRRIIREELRNISQPGVEVIQPEPQGVPTLPAKRQPLKRMAELVPLSGGNLFDEMSVSSLMQYGTLKVDVRTGRSHGNYAEYAIVRLRETNEAGTADMLGDITFRVEPGTYTIEALSAERDRYGCALGTVHAGRTTEVTLVLG